MKLPFTKKTHRIGATVVIIIITITFNIWMSYVLDIIRYHADLSFTIEWGPTYWVEDCMRCLGKPGIKLLCATKMNAPVHASRGAARALAGIDNPKYFPLLAKAYACHSNDFYIKQGIVQAVCRMYARTQTTTPPMPSAKEIKTFLDKLINDKFTQIYCRKLAILTLYRNNIDQLTVLASNEDPEIEGLALLMLAELQPENHLTAFAEFLGDITVPEQFREHLASQWAQSHRHIYFKTARGILDMPQKPEEIFREALTAVRQYGKPHDKLRRYVWQWLYWQTDVGVPITLSNSQETGRNLDAMAQTVRDRWQYKNCGKGIPDPPHSKAIETVRQCVTVPELAEDGENHLNRLAMEFLGRN